MFDTERHYFIWGSSAVAVKLHMSLSIWTRGLFFCLFKWSLTRQDCFRPTVTPIKSLTRIKLRETTTDWQVFANTTVRFHLLQPCYIFHICQHVSVSHFWSRGIEFHRGEIFWRIFFFFFFHCFASPFFFFPAAPQQCQFSVAHQKQPCLPAAEQKPSLSEPGCCHTFKLFIRILIDRNMII